MFGIGLPEIILIMAVALIVVGPEKLPELAKSIARGVVELKKAAGSLKDSLKEEGDEEPWQLAPPDQDSDRIAAAYSKLPASAKPPATETTIGGDSDQTGEHAAVGPEATLPDSDTVAVPPGAEDKNAAA